MEKEQVLSTKNFNPTACCELLSPPTAVFVSAAFQLLFATLFVITYLSLEQKEFLISATSLRPVVFSVAAISLTGTITAVVGVATEKRNFVSIQVTIMMATMLFTDVIAGSIVLIMAIGNRCLFTYELPRHFVDEEKFYSILGPFWMYIGAIILHFTVVINMCFLQVYNSYLKYMEARTSLNIQPVKMEHRE